MEITNLECFPVERHMGRDLLYPWALGVPCYWGSWALGALGALGVPCYVVINVDRVDHELFTLLEYVESCLRHRTKLVSLGQNNLGRPTVEPICSRTG